MGYRMRAILINRRVPIAIFVLLLGLASWRLDDWRLLVALILVPLCRVLWWLAIRPRPTEKVRCSIFDLQFAGFNRERVKGILWDWAKQGLLEDAQRGVEWDFVFLLAYAVLGGVCSQLATALPPWPGWEGLPAWTASAVPWLMAFAAVFDAIEDCFTWFVLGDALDAPDKPPGGGSADEIAPESFAEVAAGKGPRRLTQFALMKFACLLPAVGLIYGSYFVSALRVALG